MAYVAPLSNVRLLRGVPIDKNYKHTLYFANKTDQYNYFVSKQKYNLTQYTYQRISTDSCRVEMLRDNIIDCNYIMFQNSAFGNKWFYAFIDDVIYINNTTSEIRFTVDVIQTWLLDATLKSCTIERQHSITDAIGDSLTAEPVDLGEYVCSNYHELEQAFGSTYCVCIMVCDTADDLSWGTLNDGIFSGASIYYCRIDDVWGVEAVVEFLGGYIDKPEAIIGMYYVPKALLPGANNEMQRMPFNYKGAKIEVTEAELTGREYFQDYTNVKNKKLYTFPYNYCTVISGNGEHVKLRYEFFDDLTPQFLIGGTVITPINVYCRPLNYRGISTDEFNYPPDLQNQVVLYDYPLCSWAFNAFQQWIAKDALPVIGGAITALASPSPVVHISEAMKIGTDMHYAMIAGDKFNGSSNSGNMNISSETQTFFFTRTHITGEFARIIDDFFTKYGYSVNKVAVPNINARPHFTYIKTVDCLCVGNVPANSLRNIENIFNNGITFWKNASEVGDYSVDNSPI